MSNNLLIIDDCSCITAGNVSIPDRESIFPKLEKFTIWLFTEENNSTAENN